MALKKSWNCICNLASHSTSFGPGVTKGHNSCIMALRVSISSHQESGHIFWPFLPERGLARANLSVFASPAAQLASTTKSRNFYAENLALKLETVSSNPTASVWYFSYLLLDPCHHTLQTSWLKVRKLA